MIGRLCITVLKQNTNEDICAEDASVEFVHSGILLIQSIEHPGVCQTEIRGVGVCGLNTAAEGIFLLAVVMTDQDLFLLFSRLFQPFFLLRQTQYLCNLCGSPQCLDVKIRVDKGDREKDFLCGVPVAEAPAAGSP